MTPIIFFTQNDLFNGLEDNKKIKGKGDLEFPTNKECKGIKKFPLMFLIQPFRRRYNDRVQIYFT